MGLLIGDPIVTDSGILEEGQDLKAGAVLGVVTDTGKYKLTATKNGDDDVTDGSQNPYAVLLEDTKATSDKIVPILLMGQIDENEISFGEGWDIDTLKPTLRKISIFTKKTM